MSILDKITPFPAPPVTVPPTAQRVKEPLTAEESSLLARATTFISRALARNGVQLSPGEAKWVGAEVADFIELEKVGPGATRTFVARSSLHTAGAKASAPAPNTAFVARVAKT